MTLTQPYNNIPNILRERELAAVYSEAPDIVQGHKTSWCHHSQLGKSQQDFWFGQFGYRHIKILHSYISMHYYIAQRHPKYILIYIFINEGKQTGLFDSGKPNEPFWAYLAHGDGVKNHITITFYANCAHILDIVLNRAVVISALTSSNGQLQ